MQTPGAGRRLDLPAVLDEIGRQLQLAALVLRKHTFSPTHQLCACGRLPERSRPGFGPRCEIACHQWDRVAHLMRRILDATTEPPTTEPPTTEPPTGEDRAVGRAAVPQPGSEQPGTRPLAWLTRLRRG